MVLAFRVVEPPRSKSRPRKGRNGFYTESRTVAYEKRIAEVAILQARMNKMKQPFGSCILDLTIVYRRPKRLSRRKDSDERIICMKNNQDIDNVLKAVLDGLQRSGILPNDNLVSKTNVRRLYGKKKHTGQGVSPELACVEIRLSDEFEEHFDNEQDLLKQDVAAFVEV